MTNPHDKIKKPKKKFNPRIEVFSPFHTPFVNHAGNVLITDGDRSLACCACVACTACR